MKKLLLSIVFVALFSANGYANGHKHDDHKVIVEKMYVTNINDVTNISNTNLTDQPVIQPDNNAFDYGLAGDVVLAETKNAEFGVRGTYAYESNETRTYAYGKVYLNRMTWQKGR